MHDKTIARITIQDKLKSATIKFNGAPSMQE